MGWLSDGPDMDLREYERNKFAIAEVLRSAAAIIGDGRSGRREQIQDLFARLAEDRFNLVVVGRFSRGKTSLMNAILGTDRLPTGITPLTSVITTVTYGSKEQVVLKYESRILSKEVPIEALPQYITQQGNPGNVQHIKAAEVQLPAEILRRGFHFVDTPGLGSVIVENTLTTEAFLPEADAFLLVTSYESPLSEEELRFFNAASSSKRRIFVALNKHDTVSPKERQIVLDFVREQLETFFDRSRLQIFSISSTEGLKAKRSCDSSRLAASGIPELEKQLVNFLLAEKSTEFLTRTCDRVREFLQELSPTEEAANLIAQIGRLAKQFSGGSEGDFAPKLSLTASTAGFPNLHRLRSCEICDEIAEKMWDFLCRYQYELSISHAEQERLADRGGLCPFHAWQYEAIASPYGVCTAYPMLLDRLAAELCDATKAVSARDVLVNRIQHLLPTHEDCVLCSIRNKVEEDAVEAVKGRLAEDTGHTLNSLSAICLPHFAMLAGAVRDDEVVRQLMRRQAIILQRFSEDMRRYALKHNAVRRHLASQEETAAAERGILSLVGRRNVNFSARQTGASRLRRTQKKTARSIGDT
jgi:small GTP-binding protein